MLSTSALARLAAQACYHCCKLTYESAFSEPRLVFKLSSLPAQFRSLASALLLQRLQLMLVVTIAKLCSVDLMRQTRTCDLSRCSLIREAPSQPYSGYEGRPRDTSATTEQSTSKMQAACSLSSTGRAKPTNSQAQCTELQHVTLLIFVLVCMMTAAERALSDASICSIS
jgi:hypothetical protein